MGVGARAKISKQDANTIMVTPVAAEEEVSEDEIAAIYEYLFGDKFDGNLAKEYKEISAIFDDVRVDLTGHKFDRDAANDYE